MRTGAWMQTYSGGRFYPLDPQPDDFDVLDIAHALALTNRYCGHTPAPWYCTAREHTPACPDGCAGKPVPAPAPAAEPAPRCACTHEAGDSPCPVHGMEEEP